MADISLNKTSKNNVGVMIIGAMLLIMCITGICILLSSVISSLAEKSRLEEIGATVTLRFTAWFVLIIISTIAAGIMGAVCMSKGRKATAKPTNETEDNKMQEIYNYRNDKVETFELNIDYDKDDDIYSDADIPNHTLSENKVVAETSSGSKFKMTMNKKSDSDIAPVTTAVSEHNPIEPDERTNNFFTSGGDL